MRREERVTVQGPVKKQRPDVMSHGGGGGIAEAQGVLQGPGAQSGACPWLTRMVRRGVLRCGTFWRFNFVRGLPHNVPAEVTSCQSLARRSTASARHSSAFVGGLLWGPSLSLLSGIALLLFEVFGIFLDLFEFFHITSKRGC